MLPAGDIAATCGGVLIAIGAAAMLLWNGLSLSGMTLPQNILSFLNLRH